VDTADVLGDENHPPDFLNVYDLALVGSTMAGPDLHGQMLLPVGLGGLGWVNDGMADESVTMGLSSGKELSTSIELGRARGTMSLGSLGSAVKRRGLEVNG
jgi:hypothetical protein